MDILESQIAAGIRAIGVPAHLKGYYYLRDAIRIYAMSESPVDLSITNDIYPTVAKIYNTRPPLVEHAVRSAIEIAWTRGNTDTMREYFGYTAGDYKGQTQQSGVCGDDGGESAHLCKKIDADKFGDFARKRSCYSKAQRARTYVKK